MNEIVAIDPSGPDILHSIRVRFDAHMAGITLLSLDEESFVHLLSLPGTPEIEVFQEPLRDDALCANVIKTGQAICAPDLATYGGPSCSMLAAEGMNACISTPITKDGQTIGALSVAQQTPRIWVEADLMYLNEHVARIEKGLSRTGSAIQAARDVPQIQKFELD